MTVNPSISFMPNFDPFIVPSLMFTELVLNRANEAIDYYTSVFGGQVGNVTRYPEDAGSTSILSECVLAHGTGWARWREWLYGAGPAPRTDRKDTTMSTTRTASTPVATRTTARPALTTRLVRGIAGGLVGGMVFGMMMQMMGAIP